MLIQNFCVSFISKDLDVLYQQQAKALQDPIGFVEKLQNRVKCMMFQVFSLRKNGFV